MRVGLVTLLSACGPAVRLAVRPVAMAGGTNVRGLIVAEGADWCIVNKPAGTAVHDGPFSLLALLLGAGVGTDPVAVNRLDKPTSGVMLVAKSPAAAGRLQKAISDLSTLKTYRALLRGRLTPERGVWQRKISTTSEGRKNPQGATKDRVKATTHYEVLGGDVHASLAHLSIRTGRTHQIRKHAALAGHPVVGDERYGDVAHVAAVKTRFGFDGLALHALSLTITLDGELRTFSADMPSAWETMLQPFGALRSPTPEKFAADDSDDDDDAPGASVRTGAAGAGVVISWNAPKGYGFIKQDEQAAGAANLYVHQRSITATSRADGYRSLSVGERVEFKLATMPKDGKLEAVRVSGPGGAPVVGQAPREGTAPAAAPRKPPSRRNLAARRRPQPRPEAPPPRASGTGIDGSVF